MFLKKEHDVLDFPLLLPALFDLLDPGLSDSGHSHQPVGIRLDHLQGVPAELFHDPSSKLGTDPFDQAAPEIFFDSIYSGRQCLLKGFGRKLPAVFRVNLPGSFQDQDAAHMHLRHHAYHRHQIAEPLCPAFDHRVSVQFIMKCDAFNNTAQLFHSFPSAARRNNSALTKTVPQEQFCADEDRPAVTIPC